VKNQREVESVPGLTSPVRTWLVIFSRQGFGHILGLSTSLLFWWGGVCLKGATVAEALRGEVEDAVGALQGLLGLGFWVGGVVGLLYGIVVAERRRREDRAAE
jgi:hypothetical protein